MNHRSEAPLPNANAGVGLLEADVIEIPLLLAGWQVTALETAAYDRGLTAGELVRHVLQDFIAGLDTPGRPR